MTFETFGFNEACKRVQKVGDPLSEFTTLIDWDLFCPIFVDPSHNKTRKGGRLNVDPIVIIKLLVIQSLYNLSNPEMERLVKDCISSGNSLDSLMKYPISRQSCSFGNVLLNQGKTRKSGMHSRPKSISRALR